MRPDPRSTVPLGTEPEEVLKWIVERQRLQGREAIDERRTGGRLRAYSFNASDSPFRVGPISTSTRCCSTSRRASDSALAVVSSPQPNKTSIFLPETSIWVIPSPGFAPSGRAPRWISGSSAPA